MSIRVTSIRKTFGKFVALQGIDLTVNNGELIALLGPSGCGKTTLLRIIAGLEEADQGSGPILFHEENVASRKVGERRVGFVFQHYALFKHMTVFDNVAFGLKVKPRKERPSKDEIRERVHEILKLVQLENFMGRYPTQLSGGQRQRVALARALIIQPKVLLLDEPFGALDAKVRRELRRWLRRLHDEIHVTSIFVTHDQEEALEVADRVVIMNQGEIVQEGTPEEVYDNPKTPFVYEFLGNVNLFHSRISGGAASFHGISLATPGHNIEGEVEGRAYVRPQDFEISRTPINSSSIQARVDLVSRLGATVRLELIREDEGKPIEVEMTSDAYSQLSLQRGDSVYIRPRRARIFSGDTPIDSLTSSHL